MTEPRIYARAGEEIVCEAGHVVTRPTCDLLSMEACRGDLLEGMAHLRSGNAAEGIPGDDFPPCSCGERWYWNGFLRFREGYRQIRKGLPAHYTLQEIMANWPAPTPSPHPQHSAPRLVLIESPYAGDVAGNLAYARRAMADCFRRGEAPFASHALYTQEGVLDDGVPAERALGMEAGFAWGRQASATVVYADLGISSGMLAGIHRAEREGRKVEFRRLDSGARP